jgi:hypothetical protein
MVHEFIKTTRMYFDREMNNNYSVLNNIEES